jgi:hypothetical protein
MAKYIVRYHHKGGRVSSTIEMDEKEAREIYESDRDYYKPRPKGMYYEKISLCKVAYTQVESIELNES